MAILKCKNCGGDMELSQDRTYGVCESCGSTMTLPKVSDEQRAAAFNRGNHFRRTGEFDKALAVYERIVQEDDADAEAHWCCALCRFGIEYVEDPATYEWVPTCHRASFDSFLEDVDYLAAVEHSDGITRRQYQREAARIAEVQRGILATSQNEEPFDVFICYKESDENGARTRDSLMAQDVYYQLTEQGYRVFFSRITLEDKAGSQYEPYIFAALHSARVMVVIGTKPEHFNAVWVKNEWSRFLSLMKKDRGRLLLPCYRDMDPYDLPEALSVLQSYDMSKIGFIQDLIRGVSKVLEAGNAAPAAKETVIVREAPAPQDSAAPLLKRAFMYLEDGDWKSADEYCERVLDLDPENAEAYVGKLMAELHVKMRDALKDCSEPFDGNGNYGKAMRFGDGALKAELSGYIQHIHERNEIARKDAILARGKAAQAKDTVNDLNIAINTFKAIPGWHDADERMQKCHDRIFDIKLEQGKAAQAIDTAKGLNEAITLFKEISGWKDADERAKMCRNSIKDLDYRNGMQLQEKDTVQWLTRAMKIFQALAGWKDSAERAEACQRRIEEIKEAERIAAEQAKKKRKLTAILAIGAISAVAVVLCLWQFMIMPAQNKKLAEEALAAGNLPQAVVLYEKAGENGKVEELYLELAKEALAAGNLPQAADLYGKGGEAEKAADLYRQLSGRIAAGSNHTVGLKADGTVVAVGWNIYGQCNVSDWTNIAAVAAGNEHTVGLKADGTAVAVGDNDDGQCDVSGWTDIVAVAAGNWHTVGLKADGTVVAVGLNGSGRCDVSGWTNIVAVAAGSNHTVGLRADGTVVAVGDHDDGQCDVSGWTDIVAVAAGNRYTVGLKAGSTVVAAGYVKQGQCDVSGWTDIVAVAVGDHHTVGLKADGTAVAVGLNGGKRNVSDWDLW